MTWRLDQNAFTVHTATREQRFQIYPLWKAFSSFPRPKMHLSVDRRPKQRKRISVEARRQEELTVEHREGTLNITIKRNNKPKTLTRITHMNSVLFIFRTVYKAPVHGHLEILYIV